MVIKNIIAALTAIIAGWQNPTNLAADIEDAILTLSAANTVDPNLPITNAVLKVITKAGASVQNLSSGNLAEVGSTVMSFDGSDDKVLVFAVRQFENGNAPAASPAAVLKALNGY